LIDIVIYKHGIIASFIFRLMANKTQQAFQSLIHSLLETNNNNLIEVKTERCSF